MISIVIIYIYLNSLDVKPWDDETDMDKMEQAVRGIEMDGLLWGACKFLNILSVIFFLLVS